MHQEESDLVLVPADALHDPVDPVAGQAKDGVDVPIDQPLDKELGRDLVHRFPPRVKRRSGRSTTDRVVLWVFPVLVRGEPMESSLGCAAPPSRTSNRKPGSRRSCRSPGGTRSETATFPTAGR